MKKNEWLPLKNGNLQNGNWFASLYITGWYFVNSSSSAAYKPSSEKEVIEHKTLGPFKTFEQGCKQITI